MAKLTLKKKLRIEQRDTYVAVSTGVFLLLYFLSGTFYVGHSGLFPLSDWERNIPVVQWTMWIYVATYPLIYKIIYQIKTDEIFTRCFLSYYIMLGISVTTFVFYPVEYPRGYFPVLPEDGLTHSLFSMVKRLDSPTNCFPSLHVSTSFLFSFYAFSQSKAKGVMYILFSVAIAISTLTTKQHYLVDVIAGLILAIVLYLFFTFGINFEKETGESPPQQ